MRQVLRKSLRLVPILLSACGSSGDDGAARPNAAGTSAAAAMSAGTTAAQSVSGNGAAGSNNATNGGAGSGTPSRSSMSGGAAMSGSAGARGGMTAPPSMDEDDAGVAPVSGGDIPFSFAVSNANVNGVDFTMSPVSKLDCGTTRIDTSDPITFTNWCGSQPKPFIQLQERGTEMVVLPLAALDLPEGNTLLVTGARSLVLLVRGGVRIAGTVDVSAQGSKPGPGGDLVCEGSQGGDGVGVEGVNGGGGGGGGFGTPGGAGGTDTGLGALGSEQGAGGALRGVPELAPLLGGCRGGRGGGCPGEPGAGGGALQISASGALRVSGAIHANGGDGSDGAANGAGGGGGGFGRIRLRTAAANGCIGCEKF
jgi:hypothetical protein